MTIWFKKGVMGDLIPEAQKGLGKVAGLAEKEGHTDLYVTSIREGNHIDGSFHYIGQAFDVVEFGVPIDRIREELGPDWDVLPFIVNRENYIHSELDPK